MAGQTTGGRGAKRLLILAVGRGNSPSAGWIYLFYEHDPFKGAHMARFNLAWLLGGKATGNGIIPKLKTK